MEYYLFDPAGNITALLPVERRSDCSLAAAERVMASEPSCEQAGFVLPGEAGLDLVLEMAGGEFCGNASLCTAALWAIQKGLEPGEDGSVTLGVSGAPEPVKVSLRRTEAGFEGSIEMPRITEIRSICLEGAEDPVRVVFAPGITHAVVDESFGIRRAEVCIRSWCRQLQAEAMGIMLVDERQSRLTPLVYVPGSDTLFREHSCASGTAAVGAGIAAREGRPISLAFQEPGGILSVEASPEGRVTLRNSIRLLHHDTET